MSVSKEQAASGVEALQGHIVLLGHSPPQLVYVPAARVHRDGSTYGIEADVVSLFDLKSEGYDQGSPVHAVTECGEGRAWQANEALPLNYIFIVDSQGGQTPAIPLDSATGSWKLSPLLVARARACQDRLAKRGQAKNLAEVQVFAGDERKLSVTHFEKARYDVFFEVGGDWEPTAIAIRESKDGKQPIVVESQRTSVMQCSAEGPHVELFDWKVGRSKWQPLKSQEGRFRVTDHSEAPPFPAYKKEDLRGQIEGFAPDECAPIWGGTTYRIRRGPKTLLEIAFHPTTGC